MKYIIIEDEPLAMERVREYAGTFKYLKEAAVFEDALSAITFLKTTTVELIFLDINIGTLSGIQFLEILQPNCAVIILTAYQEFALKGFELHVTDYLLKPFSFERFCQAVERAYLLNKPAEKQFIFIRTQYRLEKVMLNALLYIEGARDYRLLQTTTGTLKTLQTFGELEKELPSSGFIRVHKSYLIAIDKIHALERDMIRIADRLIPVSETYKKAVMERLKP